MAVLIKGFVFDEVRYTYDFGPCSYSNGWAQIDTKQDASYYGTWCHPVEFLIFNYCEGDTYLTKCVGRFDFVIEMRKLQKWNDGAGHGPARIDADNEMRELFIKLGLRDMLHPKFDPNAYPLGNAV